MSRVFWKSKWIFVFFLLENKWLICQKKKKKAVGWDVPKFYHQVCMKSWEEEDLGVATLKKPQGWGGREWLGCGSSLFLTGQGRQLWAGCKQKHRSSEENERSRGASWRRGHLKWILKDRLGTLLVWIGWEGCSRKRKHKARKRGPRGCSKQSSRKTLQARMMLQGGMMLWWHTWPLESDRHGFESLRSFSLNYFLFFDCSLLSDNLWLATTFIWRER